MQKKILICTIESWNSRVGANTFSTLFSEYSSEHLANIYLREEIPDSECCGKYFQISEMRAIKSIFKRNESVGKEVYPTPKMDELEMKSVEQSREIYNKNRKKRSYLKLFVRELLWWCSKWKSKELEQFVEDFNPDVVIFGMEGYIHFNRICRYVINKSNARAIGYFWDDNFTYKQMPFNVGYYILRYFQRKSLKKTVKVCDKYWAITDKTKMEAEKFFKIDCEVLTKPIDFDEDTKWKTIQTNDPIQMLYTGNLLIGRFDTVRDIGEALNVVNADKVKIVLDVYTNSYIDDEQMKTLSSYIRMRGSVSQEEVFKLQEKADILLFVEDYQGINSQKARLSFSTKLTDYFRTGKCIFAVGAENIAPMEYLKKEDAAICASTMREIEEKLYTLANNPKIVSTYGQKAYECGLRNHSRKLISQKIDETLRSI